MISKSKAVVCALLLASTMGSGVLFGKERCERYQRQALDRVRNATDPDVFYWARQVCSNYAVDAVYRVTSTPYYSWSVKWASQVNNRYALDAFYRATSSTFYEWSVRWASRVNNYYALQAFERVTSSPYFYEWSVKWATYVHTDRELDALYRVTTRTYVENDVYWAASLDGL